MRQWRTLILPVAVMCLSSGLTWADNATVPAALQNNCLPSDTPATLHRCAREAGWVGRLEISATAYQAYLAAQPEDAEAWLEYVQVHIWRGDYGAADTALQDYRMRFGEDAKYLGKRARLLARAEWPDAAMTVNRPLLMAHPADYDLNYTYTLILRAGNRPAEAMESLAVLQELRPDSQDTLDMARFTQTPSRSHVRAGFTYFDDSDDITIHRVSVDGRYMLENKRTSLLLGYDQEDLDARLGSGLETSDNRDRISFEEGWLGLEHRWSPQVWMELRAGVADIERSEDIDTHLLSLQLGPHDKLAVQLEHKRALYDLSPRAVSLSIVQTGNLIGINWRPDLYWFLDAQAGWSDFSDANQKQQLMIAPRRAVLRRERFKLDLGVSGEWFGFEQNLNNGYYDPDLYRRYAMTAFAYRKIDDDNGISVALSLGWHRDESMSSYKFGKDIVVEGDFGIFRDWYLQVRAGYVERFNAAGSYDGLSLSASLMRRL